MKYNNVIVSIDTKNIRILGINNKAIINNIVPIYEDIFNNNFIEIITRKKINNISNLLYNSIDKNKYLFIKKTIKKYIKKKNINLNYFKIIEMFICKNDLFNIFIDNIKLYNNLDKYTKKQKYLKLLNINDYILINKDNNYKYFIKWKNND